MLNLAVEPLVATWPPGFAAGAMAEAWRNNMNNRNKEIICTRIIINCRVPSVPAYNH